MIAFLKRLFKPVAPNRSSNAMPESTIRISIHDDVFTCREPDGTERSLSKDHLAGVIIETNDLGPFAPDVYWILLSDQNDHVVFPMGASGEDRVLDALQSLPGFDNDAMIQAMSSAQNERFLCWRRPDTAGEGMTKTSNAD